MGLHAAWLGRISDIIIIIRRIDDDSPYSFKKPHSSIAKIDGSSPAIPHHHEVPT